MATKTGDDETDYESDPDEAKMSLAMRRREASDDEEDEEDVDRPRRTDSRVVIDSDEQSDGQGGAAEYDDEQFDEEDEEKLEGVEGVKQRGYGSVDVAEREGIDFTKEAEVVRGGAMVEEGNGVLIDGDQAVGEEKKENEPFSVPTAGAFYMHDDRFRDNAGRGGRNRRNFGGKNLWESRDDRKWGHDKFEELTTRERHYEGGQRGTRGRLRARGRNPVSGRGYPRGNGSISYDNENAQNYAPNTVRGRGPRRYQPSTGNKNEAPITQNKQYGRSREKTSIADSGRVITSTSTSNVESEPAPVKNNMVASSLSSSSPPFYPSGASNKHVNLTPKRDPQTVNANSNIQPSTQSNTLPRGKNVVGSVGLDKLNISGQVMGQRTGNGSQASSHTIVEFTTESSKPMNALVEKGKGGNQGNERGSLLYNSPQVLGVAGNIGVGRGDPNFAGVAPYFPAMQFGGQHPGGMGVPAVGMAYPGYVGQPQGVNSKPTWIPVLAGAAGALGGIYPYIAVDNAYHARPSGQTSSLGSSSKEITEKASDEWKPELRGNEPVQRQNKPRRYSEMNFGQ